MTYGVKCYHGNGSTLLSYNDYGMQGGVHTGFFAGGGGGVLGHKNCLST